MPRKKPGAPAKTRDPYLAILKAMAKLPRPAGVQFAAVRKAFIDAPEEFRTLLDDMRMAGVNVQAFDTGNRMARICVTEAIARAQFSLRARGRSDAALRRIRLVLDEENLRAYRFSDASDVPASPTRVASGSRA